MITLADVLADGLPEGKGVKIRTKTGRWSKVYPEIGRMWRLRGHECFVADSAASKGTSWEAGRRYLPEDTEVVVVSLSSRSSDA